MKLHLFAACLLPALVACNRTQHTEGLRIENTDSVKVEAGDEKQPKQTLVYGSCEDLDSTDYMLIPLGLKTISNERSTISKSLYESSSAAVDAVSFSEKSKYNFSRLQMGFCNNIIFYNKKTEETHLLLKSPAIISDFYFPTYSQDYSGQRFYFLLFGIRDTDSNKDGFIDSNDAEKVYMSDMSGKKIIQITPNQTQLNDWFIDVATDNIIMYVRTNSNGDKVFDAYDDMLILKSSITKPAMGFDIINPSIKADIKSILNKIK